MKQLLKISLFLVLVLASLPGFAQNNPCEVILQNGLYKYYLTETNTSFSEDIKAYFSSEKFTKDYKENKWGGTLSLIVDMITLSLGANSSDEQIKEFQEKISRSTTIKVTSSFYQIAKIAIPDAELARVYSECLNESSRTGFKVYPIVNEKSVSFVINYRKDNAADPMPKVTFFQIKNGIDIRNAPKKGDVIKENMVVTCDRNPELDLTLILETNRKTATYNLPSELIALNKDLPVGTVISSYLNFEQFSTVTKNNQRSPSGLWSSQFSKWAPCDGRSVPNSTFVQITSQSNIPDLRGVFIRGLNRFDNNETQTVDPNRANPEAKLVGQFQSDELKSHTHSYIDHAQPAGNSFDDGTRRGLGDHRKTTDPTGGAETRPRNVSLFYYIRIN